MTHTRLLSVLVCVGMMACGGNAQPGAASPASSTVSRGDTSPVAEINADQITASGGATAYDVVDQLHHRWFKDQLSGKDVTVYVDNAPIEGGAKALRDFPASELQALQYYNGQAAVMAWGAERSGGVILVVKKRQ